VGLSPLDQPEDRRLVSVLVAALPGVAALGERLDPEVLRYMEASFLDVLGRVVRRLYGTLARAGQSELVAWFGAPLGHEDDSERAVLAGLDLQHESTELRAEIERRHHEHPRPQVGIATCDVVAGPLAEVPASFTVLGPTVDLARALAHTSPRRAWIWNTSGHDAKSYRYTRVNAVGLVVEQPTQTRTRRVQTAMRDRLDCLATHELE
jgi:class 3 adenylate cyclase